MKGYVIKTNNLQKITKRNIFLLAIVPLFIVSTVLIINMFFIMMNEAMDTHIRTIEAVDFKINEFYNSAISKIQIFKKNHKNGSLKIDEFLTFDKDLDDIIVFDNNANLISVYKKNKQSIPHINYLQKMIYKNFVKLKKNFIKKIKYCDKNNYSVVSFIFRVKDRIVVFDINTLKILKFVKHLTKDIPYIKMIIADKNGDYILNTNKFIHMNQSFFDTSIYKQGVQKIAPFRRIEYYNDKRGHDDIVVYKINEQTKWYIVSVDLVDHVDNLAYTIALLIVFIAIIGILTIFGVNKFISSILIPLKMLTLKMREFSTIRDTEKIDFKSKYDIFNNMLESFNIMQEKIIHKQNELEKLNTTLEQRVAEEVKKNKKTQLKMVEQAKLAQMGEMIAMIAHQWRQPLTAINSTALSISLQARLKKLDMETAQDLSKRITQYSQHLSKTIDDFRNFFKPNKEKTLTNLENIVSDVLFIIGDSIKSKDIVLNVDIKCKNEFLSYENEIKQVILNIIKNAQDALLENKIKDPKIHIKNHKCDEIYTLEIEDNAGGISPKILDKIFEPYFSTKDEKNGTGLGLYMSKIIIEEHCNGKLTVQNKKGGAVFNIEIPSH